MARSTRIAILLATLLIVVAGTAFATQVSRPGRTETLADEPETPPGAEDLAHAVDRLKASGIMPHPTSCSRCPPITGWAARSACWPGPMPPA